MEMNVTETLMAKLGRLRAYVGDDVFSIDDWQKMIMAWADSKGWNENIDIRNELLNFHAEITEAHEELRNGRGINEVYYNDRACTCGVPSEHLQEGRLSEPTGLHAPGCKANKPEGFPVELADLAIRVLHSCAYHGIDLDQMIRIKMEYNEEREYRHGGKVA